MYSTIRTSQFPPQTYVTVPSSSFPRFPNLQAAGTQVSGISHLHTQALYTPDTPTLANKPATTLFTARRPGLRPVAWRPRPCACSGSGVQTSRSPSASVYGRASLLQGQKRLAWSVDVVKLSSSFCSISNSSDVSPAVWKNGSAPLLFWISLVSSVCECVNFLALEDGNDLLLVLL